MMNVKMTQVEAINEALSLEGLSADATEVLTKMMETINKRRMKENEKRTKNAEENMALVAVMVDALATFGEEGTKISALSSTDTDLNGLTTPKLTAIAKIGVQDGRIERVKTSKGAIYRVAEASEND